MKQTWRWYGPKDIVSISDIRQAGAKGIVTALHHIPSGDVWTLDEIKKRQAEVGVMADGKTPSTLTWDVVESLPVTEAMKTQTGEWKQHIENYKVSMRNLAAAGVNIICYNFMPVLDWTRTVLHWPVAHGGYAMRFDLTDFAAFDIHLLERPGAKDDFAPAVVEKAAKRFMQMSDEDKKQLSHNIIAGLPGGKGVSSLDGLRTELAAYDNIDADKLRCHYVDFLSEIIPLAEELNLKFCCHPDDPPTPLLGLPRVMSTEEDYRYIVNAVDSPMNGITYCTGSLGARPDVDLPGFIDRLGDKIHFIHLRNVRRDSEDVQCSFYEDEHLEGNTDMVAVIAAILREEERRKNSGRSDYAIPMRPDHGQEILSDLLNPVQPGYPAVGRLKGLAELRGIERALSQTKGYRA